MQHVLGSPGSLYFTLHFCLTMIWLPNLGGSQSAKSQSAMSLLKRAVTVRITISRTEEDDDLKYNSGQLQQTF